jgi:hypothetical protein
MYDPRVGRFLSVDPLQKKYPDLSPYQFSSNDPIESIDVDGLEREDFRAIKMPDGKAALQYLSEGPSSFKNIFNSGAIPFHLVIEYSGQHYIFADRGPNSDAATKIPADVYPNYLPGAFNYAADISKFKNDPEGFVKTHKSLEQVTGEMDDAVNDFNYKVDLATAIIGEAIGAGMAWSETHEGAPSSISYRRSSAANGGYSSKNNGSATELGFEGNVSVLPSLSKNTSGFKTLSELGLKDGIEVSSSKALELGQQFLGTGYTEPVPGSGRYVSADGTRAFRMGENDVTGAHGGSPHVNFETLVPNPNKPGKMMIDQNLHVFLNDVKK